MAIFATVLKARHDTKNQEDKAKSPGFAEAAANADGMVLAARRRQVATEVMDAIASAS